MARKSTIKLLLVNESDNEGERLISVFRNAGRVARAQRATSLENLHNLLEKESWDLLIVNEKHPEVTIEQALEQLKKSTADIPALVINDGDAIALMEAGASDVIPSDNDQRLVLAAFRELKHLDHFRELTQVKEKLSDAEERSQLLMEQSQDAIAYVADGMLISSNALFAERFDYQDPDDLDCAPVIDLIDSGDHDKFKGLLKAQLASEDGSTEFAFTGLKHGGDSFPAAMQLSNAVYDDEPCIQLSVRDPGSSANSGGGGTPDKDYLTGLYSQPYFLSQLDSALKQVLAGTSGSTLLFINVDKFSELRSRFGLSQSGHIMSQLADHLQTLCDDKACLARFSDDSFAVLLPGADTSKAKGLAESLCSSTQQHNIALDEQSIQCTLSIGIVLVDGQQTSVAAIIDSGFATADQVREANDGNGVEVFVPTRERKSLGDATNDADLDKVLEEALEDGHCVLVFQPVVSLRGASGDHYEVHTHMINEDGTEIEASDFLQSLHFNEVNTRLDRWIILESSKQLAAQIDAGHDTRLFINLTSNALRDESLIGWLGVALKAGGIPAEAIAFQFMEADILKHLAAAKTFAKAIKQLGCKIAITDFGNSDAPIEALKQLGVNYAKIADKYTRDLLGGGDIQVLKTIVTSINEHESQAIISGVENAAALAQLWQLGVDYIQGQYLAGPSRQMDYEFTDIA